MRILARRRLDSAHLIAFVALVLAVAAPASAALITAKGIANNAVESRHVKNGTIASADLKARSVTSAKLARGAVTATAIAAGSVGSKQVSDGSITAADLAAGVIPSVDIAAGSVTSAKIADGAITAAKLAVGSVGSEQLADGQVATADLADNAVTAAKIATGAVGETEIGAGAVDTIELADGAVSTPKLLDGSVTGAKLGAVIGTGVTATNVTIARGSFDGWPADETDGDIVPFTNEEFDLGGMHDNVTNASRLTAPTAGLYQVSAWVSWDADGSGFRTAQLIRDGTTIFAEDRRVSGAGNMNQRPNQSVQGLVELSAGGYVELKLAHFAGVANLISDRIRVTMHRVGTTS